MMVRSSNIIRLQGQTTAAVAGIRNSQASPRVPETVTKPGLASYPLSLCPTPQQHRIILARMQRETTGVALQISLHSYACIGAIAKGKQALGVVAQLDMQAQNGTPGVGPTGLIRPERPRGDPLIGVGSKMLG